jgi:hypothetical protein
MPEELGFLESFVEELQLEELQLERPSAVPGRIIEV